MTKKRRKAYSTEFKKEAVALITEKGYSVQEAAKAVSVDENYLNRWKRIYENEAQRDGLSKLERDELIQLRRENKQLKMEKEILKKASAFFAKELM